MARHRGDARLAEHRRRAAPRGALHVQARGLVGSGALTHAGFTKGGGWRGTNRRFLRGGCERRARPKRVGARAGSRALRRALDRPAPEEGLDVKRGCRPAHPAHARGHRGAARGVAEHARFLREGVAGGQRVARRARVEHGQVQAGRGQRDPHLLRPRREAGV